MRRKIKQYLPALLWYVQRRLEGGRGAVVSVRTRDICGVDRRCCMAVHMLMTSLVGGCGGGLNSLEGVDMTTVKKVKTVAAVFELPQKLGFFSTLSMSRLRGSGARGMGAYTRGF